MRMGGTMGNYHGEIMNITAGRNAVIEDNLIAAGVTTTVTAYDYGYRGARRAAAEIAIEADRRIAELEAQLATANERIAELEAVFGEFGEADGKCKDCGSPVALVSGSTSWGIDEEAFGQNDDIPDGLKRQAEDCRYDGVEIGGELSGHFCLKCQKLTSLYRHSF